MAIVAAIAAPVSAQPVTPASAQSAMPATAATATAGSSQPATAPAQGVAEADDLINADRPGLAEGSGVVGHGRVQVETGLQFESRHEAPVRERAFLFPTLLRIGFGDRLEARVEGNTFTTVRSTGATGDPSASTRVSGFAPLSIGAKYQLQEPTGADHPGVGALARVFPAWGTGDFRAGRTTGDLRLAIDWDLAPGFSLNPNVGVGFYEGDEERTFAAGLFAVTLTYAPTATLGLFVDLGAQTPEAPAGAAVVIIDAGIAVIVTRNIQIDVSAGSGARGHTPPHPFIAAGISLRSRALGRQ